MAARCASTFQVTTPAMASRGGEAELSVRGELRIRFNGIERAQVIRVRDTIGRVSVIRE